MAAIRLRGVIGSDPRVAHLLVNLAALMWASNILLGRALRDQVGPLTLSTFRFLIAGTLYAAFFWFSNNRDRRQPSSRTSKQDWLLLFAMGFTGVFAFPALLYLALQQTTATNTALINGTGPLITAVLASFLLGERLLPERLVGTLISLAGVAIVIAGGTELGFGGLAVNPGDWIALLDVVLWGLYSILARLATRTKSAFEATALSTVLALPLLIAASLLEWKAAPPTFGWPVLLAGLYIGVFPTFFAFLAWNEGVRRVGPAQAMAFYNMLPVYGVALGALFLGETPGWNHFLGGGLVILGGVISYKGWQSKSPSLPE